MNALRYSRIKRLLLLIFANIVTGYFMVKYSADLLLLICGSLLMLFNIIAMAGNIMQLVIIRRLKYFQGKHMETGLLQAAALLQSVALRFRVLG